MSLNAVLVGLTIWTMVSVVVGLGLGALLRRSSELDEALARHAEVPIRKSA